MFVRFQEKARETYIVLWKIRAGKADTKNSAVETRESSATMTEVGLRWNQDETDEIQDER